MIPVKIAANLSATGVDGVRWVLVDAAEPDASLPSTAPADEAPKARRRLRRAALLWLVKALLLLAGLTLAWLTTGAMLATPRAARQAAPPVSTAPATKAAEPTVTTIITTHFTAETQAEGAADAKADPPAAP